MTIDVETLHSIIDNLPEEVTKVNLVADDTLKPFKITEVFVNDDTLSLVFKEGK